MCVFNFLQTNLFKINYYFIYVSMLIAVLI